MSIQWTGLDQMNRNLDDLPNKVMKATMEIALFYAAVMERYAKQNATWTDRTAIARQSLFAFAEQVGQETVELYLAHGVDYGIFLEVRWAGRFAIIWPTIELHLPEINKMMQKVFS